MLVLILLLLGADAAPKIEEFVQVDLVDLYLTATDGKGRFVPDLKQEELAVKEDGVPQQIERFGQFAGEKNEIPLLLAVVIDNSASMDESIGDVRKLDLSRDVALLLIKQLGPLDRILLVRFAEKPLYTPITSDKEAIVKLLNEMRTIWWHTALFDSVASAIQELNRNEGRKILFVCSDGRDNMSQTRFEKVTELAASTPDLSVVVLGAGATNQVVGLHGSVRDIPNVPYLRGKEYLQNLADKTAGFAYFPENVKDAKKLLELMSGFIRSQYYLAYRSTNRKQDGSWRWIEISCKRRGVTLHYRRGYYAK